MPCIEDFWWPVLMQFRYCRAWAHKKQLLVSPSSDLGTIVASVSKILPLLGSEFRNVMA